MPLPAHSGEKPESSKFNKFWMQEQVRHDDFEAFYEIVK